MRSAYDSHRDRGAFVNTNRMEKENLSMNGVDRLPDRYWIGSLRYHVASVLDLRDNAVWGD
jgi:hypothetical protein